MDYSHGIGYTPQNTLQRRPANPLEDPTIGMICGPFLT
jgi:hypothetical protein